MKLPPHLKICHRKITLTIGETLAGSRAHYDSAKHDILLDQTLGDARLAETLVHEILHALIDMLDADMGDKDEERLVRSLTPFLVSLIVENPALIREIQSAFK